jgi:hypothetical protein
MQKSFGVGVNHGGGVLGARCDNGTRYLMSIISDGRELALDGRLYYLSYLLTTLPVALPFAINCTSSTYNND